MPQITCPNCGMTINLENRRKIDFNIIVGAAKKEPKTFTELLHVTKLSRKTLSLRLKELCENGVLTKEQGMYKLNGGFELKDNGRDFMKGFSRAFRNQRTRAGLMFIAFLLCSSVSGYALATFLIQPHQKTVIGNFMMGLDVSNVNDLYAWQAFITFNSNKLKVIETTPGEFFKVEYPFFLNATDIGEGKLLLAGTLCGGVSGQNGSGRLATIVFGYFEEEYEEPRMVLKQGGETCLLNSNGSLISDGNLTILTLTTIENS